mmetsp:Transcript_15354/g.58428  ORF Transcript_15354/g.58428 Transcript_15354/m.58428 type:complete len:234 (+) Transcript_15354:567-1268(+)
MCALPRRQIDEPDRTEAQAVVVVHADATQLRQPDKDARSNLPFRQGAVLHFSPQVLDLASPGHSAGGRPVEGAWPPLRIRCCCRSMQVDGVDDTKCVDPVFPQHTAGIARALAAIFRRCLEEISKVQRLGRLAGPRALRLKAHVRYDHSRIPFEAVPHREEHLLEQKRRAESLDADARVFGAVGYPCEALGTFLVDEARNATTFPPAVRFSDGHQESLHVIAEGLREGRQFHP